MPNEEKFKDLNDPEAVPGVICKVASVQPLEVTEEDLKKINEYTLNPVTAEEVFIFKATMADNEQDDRNFMPFDLKALKALKKLYPGKTMLKDHSRRADNQIARIYDTELVQDASKQTELGEVHTELVAKIYMIKTDSNKDLIAEIKGGIKKEVSTSCTPEKMVCNICGTDNMKEYCRHWPGVEYTVDDGTAHGTKKRCKMLLSGAKEAYELSFVAVPAQPRAGTHKSIGFTKPVPETEVEDPENKGQTETNNVDKDLDLAFMVRETESFIFTENNKEG